MKIEDNAALHIPGLQIFSLETISDNRGYFQEKFQKEILVSLGFPAVFSVEQMNISYNKEKGVIRGLHAEPWDKYISVVKGKVFCAFVDLRPGASYGNIFTTILDETQAIFLPRGVANSYQTLEEDVYYAYLVNDHWSPGVKYTAINVADPTLKIDWPIPINQAIISEKDKNNPYFTDLKV